MVCFFSKWGWIFPAKCYYWSAVFFRGNQSLQRFLTKESSMNVR
jgi:hypothetical protein